MNDTKPSLWARIREGFSKLWARIREGFSKLWHKYVNRETISYLIFGVLTTVVNYVALFLISKAPFMLAFGNSILSNSFISSNFPNATVEGVTVLFDNALAWVVAVIFAFITNKIFVFESKSVKPSVVFRELGSFTLARLLSLGFEELFLFLTVTLGGMNMYLAKVIAAVVVVILNYFASKFLIFTKKEHKEEENPTPSDSETEDSVSQTENTAR